ncbi:sugar phosphate isomerase/epimerase family protein [Methanotorris igneus]|nr:sugar phosphate isomerase/epimerase family protein [Methanotorris igneus]
MVAKIGVSMSVFLDSEYSLNDALEFLESRVRYVELICDGNMDIMEKFEDLETYNLKYTIHSPITDINLSSHREKVRTMSIEIIEDVLKTSLKVDARLIVVHPGYSIFKHDYERNLNSLINSLKDLNKLKEEYGIDITIENMPSYDMFMFRHPDEYIINNLDEVKITFDIGHSFLNGNIDEFLKIDSIIHTHIHDNNGEFDEHLPIGMGKINFDNFKDSLKNIKGIKMIELQHKSFEYIDDCISKLKNLIK